MDPNLNLSENHLDVCDTSNMENHSILNNSPKEVERPITKELMDALQLASNKNDYQGVVGSREECFTCECQGGEPELKEFQVLAKEEIVTTSSNTSEKQVFETLQDVSDKMVTFAEDEKQNQSFINSSNDANLIGQSYYITIDDQTGEQYAILTLDRFNSDNNETKSAIEDSICFSNESNIELKDIGNTSEQQQEMHNYSQHYSPLSTTQSLEVTPSSDHHILTENSCCPPPQSNSSLVCQPQRSFEGTPQESKRFLPYCQRPLLSSTPYSSSTFSSKVNAMTCRGITKMSASSCYNSFSSVNLNSGGEETSSSSDNNSLNIPRVPQNTPESNCSMPSQITPSSQVPLSRPVFEPPSTSQNNDSCCLREFILLQRPVIASNCPKEIHNEKERFRRGRIKKACLMLRDTVPGLSDKTDKATVLETTEFLEKSFQF